ncbi:uracil-DNA glycosylase, partial [Burkholderia cenocepacia]
LEELGHAHVWGRRGQRAAEGAAAECAAVAPTAAADDGSAVAVERPVRAAHAPVQGDAPTAVPRGAAEGLTARESRAPGHGVVDGARPRAQAASPASTDTMTAAGDAPPAAADELRGFAAAQRGEPGAVAGVACAPARDAVREA